MKLTGSGVPTAVALFLLTSWSPAADACSCAITTTGPFLVVPGDGEVGVPRNARVWLGGDVTHRDQQGNPQVDQQPRIRLERSASGTPVDGSISSIRGGLFDIVTVVTPFQQLDEDTEYRVIVRDVVVSSFSTGSERDTASPAVPNTRATGSRSDLGFVPGLDCSTCAPGAFASVAVDGEGILFVAQLEGEPALDEDAIDGDVADMVRGEELQFGSGACSGNWPGAGPLASKMYRVGAYDVAGNFSGWTAPRLIVLPPPGCSCAIADGSRGSSVPGLVALTSLLLATARRRRSEPRSRRSLQ